VACLNLGSLSDYAAALQCLHSGWLLLWVVLLGRPYKPDYAAAIAALGLEASDDSVRAVKAMADVCARLGIEYPVQRRTGPSLRLRRFAVTA
jgi:hypothetical protein